MIAPAALVHAWPSTAQWQALAVTQVVCIEATVAVPATCCTVEISGETIPSAVVGPHSIVVYGVP